MQESRNAHKVMVEKSERKRPLGRHRQRWEDNIKCMSRYKIGALTALIWLRKQASVRFL